MEKKKHGKNRNINDDVFVSVYLVGDHHTHDLAHVHGDSSGFDLVVHDDVGTGIGIGTVIVIEIESRTVICSVVYYLETEVIETGKENGKENEKGNSPGIGVSVFLPEGIETETEIENVRKTENPSGAIERKSEMIFDVTDRCVVGSHSHFPWKVRLYFCE